MNEKIEIKKIVEYIKGLPKKFPGFKKREGGLDFGEQANEMNDKYDLENMAYGAKQYQDFLIEMLERDE